MTTITKYIFVLCVIIGLASAACEHRVRQPPQSSQQSGPRERPSPIKTEVVIAAAGDIMMPGSIQNTVAQHDSRYDVSFENIAADLSAADISFANLETPVDERAPVSGYPRYNARPELLAALKKAGIGIVSVANNHALDAGPDGLKQTLDNIEAAGLLFTGANRIGADGEQITFVVRKGVTIAFLAYTYGTNERMPKNKAGMPIVNILGVDSEPGLARAAASVRKARLSADLVVVSLHWSDEYGTVPTIWQRRVATELIESGADVILGHHPQVLQPIESYTAQNGRVGLIAFSLGNLISSQNDGVSNRNRMHARALGGDGIILTVFVRKEAGRTSVTRAEFLPIWTLRERIGKTVGYRTVSIDREIARLRDKQQRLREEENNLQLLIYRKKVISDALLLKPWELTGS